MNIIKNKKEIKTKKIFDLNGKKTLKRGPFGSALKKSFFVPSGFKVYEQKNAIRKNINDGDYYINESKYQELINFNLLPNDIIVSCSGTVGEVYMIPENAPEGVINQALLRIRLAKNDFPLYYYYYFSSSRFKSKLLQDSMGGVIKNISGMETLNNIEVIDISYEEQKNITKILKLQDDKLKNIKELLEKIEIRNQYYADKLLSGELSIENNQIKNMRIDLNQYILKDIVSKSITSGSTPKNISYEKSSETPIKYYKVENVDKQLTEKYYITEQDNEIQKRSKLAENDILITIAGTLGKLVFVKIEDLPANINQAIAIVRVDENKCNKKYVYYFLKTIEAQINKNRNGGVIQNLNLTTLSNFDINVPSSMTYQKEIVTFLDNLEIEKEKVERLLKLEEQRFEWLSDKLLSGEYIIED